MKVPIRKNSCYWYANRLVRLIEPAKGLPPGFWIANYTGTGEEVVVSERKLQPIAVIKRSKDGGI